MSKKSKHEILRMMNTEKPELLIFENYIATIKASLGTKIFRNLYFRINNKKVDVLRDGDLSCAFFVSTVLKLFGLIGEIHTTVIGTVQDLKILGWKRIEKPRLGAIIVYGPKKFKSGETHKHIGFYIGGNKAISNSSKNQSPRIHRWNYRHIEEILWKNIP